MEQIHVTSKETEEPIQVSYCKSTPDTKSDGKIVWYTKGHLSGWS